MTIQQKEQLREVLIDYLEVLTSTVGLSPTASVSEMKHNARIAQVRLLLKEVA